LLDVVNMVLILVTGIRAVYLGLKLRFYMEERYPEKAAYLLSFFAAGRWWRWFHEPDDTGDPHLVSLKERARTATCIAYLVAVLTPLFWIAYLVSTRGPLR
jgi:hypothetical protein